ncbi:MAG: S41 family peptidase [Cryomorphaceae bacterium]|nr:S41 family peptidase [Cryomorphaceae bacterium]
MKKFRNWFVGISLVIGGIFLGASSANYFEINKQLDIFTNIFKEINLYYVDETQPQELMEKAITSMLRSLDPYTNYIRETDVEDFRIQTTGQYGGIGASIRQRDDHVMVVMPYEGFPADKAGLKAGDLLLKIDDDDLKGLASDEVSRLLKGSPGSSFQLTFERDGKVFKKKITREEVQLKSVPYCGMVGPNIGYIRLNSFTNKASKEISEAMDDLKKDNELKGLILDLRGNPGGLLTEAINVSNLFVPKGEEVVSTRGRIKEWDRSYKTLNSPVDTEIPLVVLINRSSASASEIVSGTIQDLDRGVVIGQRSFGKGLVQQTRKLTYGAQIKVTVSKYHTPSGRCIQAINYAERRDDGSVEKVPDSLRMAFQTVGGRLVYDGGGIDPDIDMEVKEASKILRTLISNSYIFDYATQFQRQNAEIPEAGTFKLNDAQYKAFMDFLADKDIDYETKTENLITELKEAARDEKYFESLERELNKLKKEFKDKKAADLFTFKDDIIQQLEAEIVSRYYYQEGRSRQMINYDDEVKKAIEVLLDRELYNSILSPPEEGASSE